VNIARLRQKVEPEPSNPKYVITRPGIGYSLTKIETNGTN
jgi:DNA-binding response OmpR family regulator